MCHDWCDVCMRDGTELVVITSEYDVESYGYNNTPEHTSNINMRHGHEP